MMESYDVVIAGGSIAGLLCAREIASSGNSVLVLEKDHEIGTPQHCGGMVSRRALAQLGIIPSVRTAGNTITSVQMLSPGGQSVTVETDGDILEVNRRALDKHAAAQAQRAGATIRVGVAFRGPNTGGVRTSTGDVRCDITVDARGVAALPHGPDILVSTQYEVQASWIMRGKVVVMLDQDRYPGFFAWIIPAGAGRGKVGVAGRRINGTVLMEQILEQMGGGSILRRIIAPIWVGGPIERFVQDTRVIVGDAAGQSKPTTGGGIYSSGMGGILAGQAIARYLKSKDTKQLDYKPAWMKIFGREFQAQKAARHVLERLDNPAIDSIVGGIRLSDARAAGKGDFDFHSASILTLLGIGGTARIVGAITSSEVRHLLGRFDTHRT